MQRLAFALFLIVVTIVSFALNTAYNDFPMSYHPDEPGKVRQLMDGKWNFNHPHLMMAAARVGLAGFGPDKVAGDGAGDGEAVARVGRGASAALAALAVAALAITAALLHGYAAGCLVGLLVMLCPSLVGLAHYLKEDASLVFGLAVLALTLAIAQRWPRWWAALLIGVGCGLAASGKYAGVLVAAAALAAVLIGPIYRRWWTRPIAVLAAAAAGVAVWAAVNYEAVADWGTFRKGFDREYEHATTDHGGLYKPWWSGAYLRVLMEQTPWLVLAASASAAVYFAVTARRQRYVAWLLLLFPLVYLGVVMSSRIFFPRYMLPLVVGVTYLAGVGAAGWSLWPRLAWRRGVALTVIGGALVAVSAWRCADWLDQFADDSRDRLAAWVVEELEPGARILQDTYAGLPAGDLREQGYFISTRWRAADMGPLPRLRRRGFTHVVVCALIYDRYIRGEMRPTPGYEAKYERVREWYRTLPDRATRVWASGGDTPTPLYANPAITVYALTP